MKTLYESIMQFRSQSHEIEESILNKSGVGKIYLIQKWLDEHGIKNYTINNKEEVDVDGDVDLSKKELTEFPPFIQFGTVKGYFNCSFNGLVSLRGCPRVVEGGFLCFNNKLTSLKGAPEKISGNFYCGFNLLNTLEGAPMRVTGYFNCSHNITKFTENDVREVCKVKKGIIVR